MSESEIVVFFIVDPEFSGNLEELVRKGFVWIVRSAGNDEKRLAIRYEELPPDRLTDFEGSGTPLEVFEDWLWTVDLHHGEYAELGPWERMHVIGLDAGSVNADWIGSVVKSNVRIEAGDGEFIIHRELS